MLRPKYGFLALGVIIIALIIDGTYGYLLANWVNILTIGVIFLWLVMFFGMITEVGIQFFERLWRSIFDRY